MSFPTFGECLVPNGLIGAGKKFLLESIIMARVLIIDDDEIMNRALARIVEHSGHEAGGVFTLREGLSEVESGNYEIVFLDVRLPDGNGLEILPQLLDAPSSPEVIIITGAGDPDGAELAINNGAWDYIQKTSSLKEIKLALARALQYGEEKKNRSRCAGRDRPVRALRLKGLIGDSPRFRACLDLLAEAAASDVNVLLTGETGTGKELFARAIHENSPRAERDFVVVECTALPESLVESTLFGHEKGAFTGAGKSRDGLIKQADQGTLFLDEVSEMSLSIQKVFLRVLQERQFRPVGSTLTQRSSFKLVAATNRDLGRMVEKGEFRKDLLYRISSLVINLPPLRERREDIKNLALYHMARFCERNEVATKGFSPGFFDVLLSYDWPGNVRELVNVIERSITVGRKDQTIFPKQLPPYIRVHAAKSAISKAAAAEKAESASSSSFPSLNQLRKEAIESLERQYLLDLISHTEGNIELACRVAGLQRTRLYELLKKYGISVSRSIQ